MPIPPPPFAFALCNVRSEAALVREVARLAPGAAAAYRRPGLVTFKLGPSDGAALARSVFARVHGASLGLARSAEEVLGRVAGPAPLRLHVYGRDAGPDGPDAGSVERARDLDEELRSRGSFLPAGGAEVGDTVLDVVVGPEADMLVGRRHQGLGWRLPGGRLAVEMPPEAPSRAFAKLEQALAWSGLVLAPGQSAIELGSAPGGAAYALARRGVSVLAVDPADMAPQVLAFAGPAGARVTHLRLEAGALRRHHAPAGCSLLLCDLNLAPPVALRYVRAVARWLGPSLTAAILTLKLNDRRMEAAIPELLAQVSARGLQVRATQLPANRQEICVVGQR